MSSNTSSSTRTTMVFSPRSKTRSGQGLPVSHLSQAVLASQVTSLLNKVESLHQEIENRDKILQLAKAHFKKRSIPILSKQVAILQASGRAKPSEEWLLMSDSNSGLNGGDGASADVEIRHDESDDDQQDPDEHDDHELQEQESDDAGSDYENQE